MRVPLSWLREYADLPANISGRDVAERLIRAGLEVERVEVLGADLAGSVVVGQVLGIEELTEFRKPIRYCRVAVGESEPRGIICGARNFALGNLVVVALPGAVLPGGFIISARPTYGRVSDGMICSARELGIGEDHDGIIVLPADAADVGADAITLLGLRDEVLDIAVTPDRGYCLSMRGIAREVAIAYGVAFREPAGITITMPSGQGHPASIADRSAADRFVLRSVTGFDPTAPSPLWLQQRLRLAGMRPISLAVDITNYVTHELGQPLHAFDRGKLSGPIAVRRARAGEKLQTLDHAIRELDSEDILITDSSGPISLAGTMGGLLTEIDANSTDIVLEAAHFDAIGIARMSRRHKLSSEASRRFERSVDPELPPVAAARAARLLVELGGGIESGVTEVNLLRSGAIITMRADYPGRVAGISYSRQTVLRRLDEVGCAVAGDDVLTVTPPSWRPDLTDPNDVVEEVVRLEGYDQLPATLPQVPPGRGYTPAQRLRRRVSQALAVTGYVEVLCPPFVSPSVWHAFGLTEDDPRRRAVRLTNPLSEEEPELRTTLLPGLLTTLRRNVGRGLTDVALFEMGLVYHPRPGASPTPRLGVDRQPTDSEIAALEAALPDQPRHVAVVLTGNWEPAGWWGTGRPADWADAIQAARVVAQAARVELAVRVGQCAPWHPGRCAQLLVGDTVVGHAGELHPRVTGALSLPARACAMELDLDRLAPPDERVVSAPKISTYPAAAQDVALVVADAAPAAEVAAALREGAGKLLESLRLFDVYTGGTIGVGQRSLAYTLRFRAPDRTLTADEVSAARQAAVAEATRRTGAILRGA